MNHAGKVAVVTGASSGIGQAIALRLAKEGALVANVDLADGAATEEMASAAGSVVKTFPCDLSNETQIHAALGAVVAHFKKDPLILVHAAAALFLKPFAETTTEEWRLTQKVNQESAFHLMQGLLPMMQKQQWGRVVLVTSSTFFIGGTSMTHYVTSKGALIGFAHGLAPEVGVHGITVNCLAPGLTKTAKVASSMTDEFFAAMASAQSIKRTGRPEDQAGMVSFLVSEDASFITGQTLVVDGGQALT